MAFDGTADYTLDAKNRLTVPARFRDQLAAGLVLAKGAEPYVGIWPKDAYEEFKRAALEGLHPMSQNAQKIKRFYSANSLEQELDSAGRVALRSDHLEHAGLGKEVTVIGADDHLEVWDRKAWATYNAQLTADVLGIAEGFDQ